MKEKRQKSYDSETLWWCDACHGSGIVESPHAASLYEVVNQISSCHDALEVAVRQGCVFKDGQVRVKPLLPKDLRG